MEIERGLEKIYKSPRREFTDDPNDDTESLEPITSAKAEPVPTRLVPQSRDQISFILNVRISPDILGPLGVRNSYVLRGKPVSQCIMPLFLGKGRAIHLMVEIGRRSVGQGDTSEPFEREVVARER